MFTLTKDSKPVNLLVKISEDIPMGEKELGILMTLNGSINFPKVTGGGQFTINNNSYHFIIMEKLGSTLDSYFAETFSLSTVCKFGMTMLESLENLHAIGYVHNDLKLQNILIGDSSGYSLDKITLIDFGLCSSFRTAYTAHILPKQTAFGKGNLAFSSFDCLNGKATSRRDDLISLLYIMLYLHSGDFAFQGIDFDTMTE